MLETARNAWHPIASTDDLPFRHVFHGQLLGRELAVWRADDGHVNVWENRCLHRGVRLSIGINDGAELKCQYHGWRYANRTAACTYIPAHPADAPARTICNRTYPAVERYGLIWSGEAPDGDAPTFEDLDAASHEPLRGVAINGPAPVIVRELQTFEFELFGHDAADAASAHPLDDFAVQIRFGGSKNATHLMFFVQPVDANRSAVRGILSPPPPPAERVAMLRFYNSQLNRLRDHVEGILADQPAPKPFQPEVTPLSMELAEMPAPSATGRVSDLRVTVARKWPVGEGIAGFKLSPLDGILPGFQPGAHIDVHMPNGEIRQYSLTNGPGETDSYIIGVKLEPDSKGGSKCMHETVREGDLLAISAPRNNFPLRRDAKKTILVAGGIGITPIIAMAKTLKHLSSPCTLHYFAQSAAHVAFDDTIEGFGADAQKHLGLPPDETRARLEEILTGYAPGTHFYVCGPGPMLEAAREVAAASGWPDEAVHFEYFKNNNELDQGTAFEIALARSNMSLEVPAGKSIIDVLRENGVSVPSSCEQGACGTCVTDVLEGEPDHQDVYLRDTDKESGEKIMICVSRAHSARLVLDI